MTHRQFLAWQEWLDEDFNRPSRADHYAMATTVAVKQVLNSKPGNITIKQQILKFAPVTDEGAPEAAPSPPMSVEQAAALSKARWGGFMQARGEKPPPRRTQPGRKG